MKRMWIAVCLGLGFLEVVVAQSQEPAPLQTTLSVGVTITDGNSETLQANGSIVTEGEKKGLGSLRAGIEANYGESTVNDEKDTTVNNSRAFAHARKTISPRTFGYLDGSILQDDIAEIDYRLALGPGLGVYLLKTEKTSLSVEAGLSYVWEKVADLSDDYLALRFAERLDHALSATAKIWQSAEYVPNADDVDDYLLNAELGIQAALNTRMDLRLVLQDKYDSTPGNGLEKNDLSMIAGIGLSL